MATPSAEIDIDEPLVRSLLAEQQPALAVRALQFVANGWDNVVVRLGDDLMIRLPRSAAAAQLVLNEQRWLPQLAPRLPLPIPTPVYAGAPSSEYPFSPCGMTSGQHPSGMERRCGCTAICIRRTC